MESFLIEHKDEIIEGALFSVGPLTALMAARCGLKSWLKYEIVSTLLIAAILMCCPCTIFKFIVRCLFFKQDLKNINLVEQFLFQLNVELQQFHRFIAFCLGGYLVASILSPLLLSDSNDDSIFSGHLWAKLIVSCL